MKAEITGDGVLWILGENQLEDYALIKWQADRKHKLRVETSAKIDYLPLCVELTDSMRNERDQYKKFKAEQAKTDGAK